MEFPQVSCSIIACLNVKKVMLQRLICFEGGLKQVQWRRLLLTKGNCLRFSSSQTVRHRHTWNNPRLILRLEWLSGRTSLLIHRNVQNR